MAVRVYCHSHGWFVRTRQIVAGGDCETQSWCVDQGSQHNEDGQEEKNYGKRGHVEPTAEDAGIAGELHPALAPGASVTMLTISVAVRSISRTMEFTRLTR